MPGAAASAAAHPRNPQAPASDSTASFGATNGELSDGKYPSMIATAAAASAYPTAAADRSLSPAASIRYAEIASAGGRGLWASHFVRSSSSRASNRFRTRRRWSERCSFRIPARDHHVGARRPGGATSEMKAPGGAQQPLDGAAAVGDGPLGEALDAGDADGGRRGPRLVGGIKIAHPVSIGLDETLERVEAGDGDQRQRLVRREEIVVIGDLQVVLVDQVVRADHAARAGEAAGQKKQRVGGEDPAGGGHHEQIDVIAAARVSVGGPARQRQRPNERQRGQRRDDAPVTLEQLGGPPDAIAAPGHQRLSPTQGEMPPASSVSSSRNGNAAARRATSAASRRSPRQERARSSTVTAASNRSA